MRILTVCGTLGRGGTERVAQNFTLAYQRAGHSVAFLAYDDATGPRRARLEAAGVPIFGGGGGGDRDGDAELALRQLQDFNPELIHIHRPGIRNDRETELLRRLRTKDRRVLETNVFARVDFSDGADLIDVHLHLTPWCLWRWQHWLGRRAAPRRIGVVVPNAVETADFVRASDEARRQWRRTLDIPDDAYLCGRVGQPLDAGWHPHILHAFAAVAREDRAAHLVVIGLPPGLRPVLQELPDDVRRRVRDLPLTDSDAELIRLYSSLDCFLHSAAAGESFGMVLTEAMLCGCPVVTASRPHKSNSHIIVADHMRAGIVAGSVKRLPEAALRMWSDRDLRQRLAAATRQSIFDRFSADLVAARAVRVGEIALGLDPTAAGTSLRQHLADAGFQTHVPTSDIRALLANTLGSPDLRELLAMRILHQPATHRMVYQYLKWRYYRRLPK
jgi:glycosyltransferase involved in cell wall biosynthesis